MGERTSTRPPDGTPGGAVLAFGPAGRTRRLDAAALLTFRDLAGVTDAATEARLDALIGEAENLEAVIDGFAERVIPAIRVFDDSLGHHRLTDDAVVWACEQSGYYRLTATLARMGGRLVPAADGVRL